ncbi:MAG: molybdopterin adenylyltransferase [Planctomyces sp.]|jgi:molybdopterin adenylyltransferase|nr:molybdopterin adenylyltransferase [Planctomyces sp.]
MNLQPDSLAESVSKTSARKPGSSMSQAAIIGILTVSDRASRGDYEDRGGPAIQAYLTELMSSPWMPVSRIVSDDRHLIAAELRKLADETQCCLIVTTGGTGPAVRDVTPEATGDVCEKMLPGFGELMRKVSLEKVPTAILSRQTAGIRGKALIINLPGQPRAIRECLSAVMPAVPWCIELIGGPRLETVPEVCRSYRPPGA